MANVIFLTETIPIANFVTTNYPWNKTCATPEMTGIPADVLLMAKMARRRRLAGNVAINHTWHCPIGTKANGCYWWTCGASSSNKCNCSLSYGMSSKIFW